MKPLDVIEMLALGIAWGGSFLFMRIAAPEFGPIALIAVRVSIAALVLLPFLLHSGKAGVLLQHGPAFIFFGAINSGLPFCLFAFATLSLNAGFTSVLNATAPLFTAIVAYLWLSERLSRLSLAGLLVGFSGVVLLVSNKLGFAGEVDVSAAMLGIAAGLLASFSYGCAANYIRARFVGVGSLELAAGSQVGSSLLFLPLCFWFWPSQTPSAGAWSAVLALGIVCTGLAYIVFFRLIGRLGPSRAITVTFLVPVSAMVFGALFLGEIITLSMLFGCGLILLGTALATGLLNPGNNKGSA